MKHLISALSLGALVFGAACAPGPESEHGGPEAEACEHLQEGPSSSHTAGTDFDGAPDISEPHLRHDVSLIEIVDGNGGSVAYAAGEAGELYVFLSADIPLAVYDSSGSPIAIAASEQGSELCDEVAARHLVGVEVGTYELRFGPTEATEVSVVIEPASEAAEPGDGA